MPDLARLFPGLRRSLLGAWLAVVYALAVLAAALAPVPALANATAGLAGAMLCSGATIPGQDEPAMPAADGFRCKGCPLQPLLQPPGPPRSVQDARPVTRLVFALPAERGLPTGIPEGLAQPRAPPVGSATAATLS